MFSIQSVSEFDVTNIRACFLCEIITKSLYNRGSENALFLIIHGVTGRSKLKDFNFFFLKTKKQISFTTKILLVKLIGYKIFLDQIYTVPIK